MTRILAFADLHLGSGSDYADDRLADQEAVLEQIADLAAGVDLVLFAGDAFHYWRPPPAQLHVFARFVKRLERLNVPCVAVLGNTPHDQGGVAVEAALELFDSPLFRVSRFPEVITEFAGVNVCTLPSTPTGRIVAAAEGGDRGNVFERAARLLEDTAANLAQSASLTPGCSTFLLGHWSLTGASLPNGLPVADLHEPVLELAALERCGFDAIVLGHIHKPQTMAMTPEEPYCPILYCGSPMPLNFGEADVEHGCWLLDAREPFVGTSVEFVPLESRPFVTLDYGDMDPAFATVMPVFPADAIVRVKYRATEAVHRIVDQAGLKKNLLAAGAHRVYQIVPEIIREDRARVAGVDETQEPLALVEKWCEANEVGPEAVLALAREYIGGGV